MKRAILVLAFVALATASAALATKPGSGSSEGTGRVFVPNPVQDLGNESLTDQKDADYAALAPAYHTVTLTHLDGSGFLHGDWATIVGSTGNLAYSPANTFLYGRNQDEFEQVMAYYWITEAQEYIQSLGFGTGKPLPPINEEPQRLRINQWGVDNSFATEHKDEMRLGKGGVDDAEDAEVILHEYGHAIHFAQGFQFSTRGGRRDQRGVRRLLGGDGLRARPRGARPARIDRSGLRRRLGLDVLHRLGAALPAARRRGPDVPGRSRRRGPRRRGDLVAGALGHPWRDRPDTGGHRDPRRAVRLRRRHDARARA